MKKQRSDVTEFNPVWTATDKQKEETSHQKKHHKIPL